MTDFMGGNQAVEGRVAVAFAEACTEPLPAKRTREGDADRGVVGAYYVFSRPQMSKAVGILGGIAIAVRSNLIEQQTGIHLVRKRIRGVRCECFDNRHVDLNADLCAVNTVDVIEPRNDFRIGVRTVPAEKFEITDSPDVDFRYCARALCRCCTELGRERLVSDCTTAK